MSVITVQLGQCGNQIGGQLFTTLLEDVQHGEKTKSNAAEKDFGELSMERFFNYSPTHTAEQKAHTLQARAVMVDMEQKVIQQAVHEAKKTGRWEYPTKSQFCQKRGSGNNWAHGFCSHGPAAGDAVLEMIQRQAEKCDNLNGFFTLMSLAGGTGSGVGSYITQRIRDDYPHSFIMNQVVAPYSMGEVITQNYNACLTLSHLYQTSDAVLLLDNDSLHKTCSQLLAIKNIGMRELNHVISHKLVNMLQPAYKGLEESNNKRLIQNHLGK